MVAGDQRALEEAAHLLPGARTVGVKAGTSRTSAILRSPEDAREELAEAVRQALAEPPEPLRHPFPAEATIRYAADRHAARAGKSGVGERTGRRDVSARLGSVHDLAPFLARGLLATGLGTGPALENRLYPTARGTFARLRSACLLGLTGWIERRVVRAWARERPDLYPAVVSRP